jgi:hypothetical protein
VNVFQAASIAAVSSGIRRVTLHTLSDRIDDRELCLPVKLLAAIKELLTVRERRLFVLLDGARLRFENVLSAFVADL